MPRALTAEEEEYAQKAAQDWFRYERATEAHASVLRKEPARFMEEFAKQDPATLSGPLPPKPELDGVVASYEVSLAKECTTFEEHLEVLNASLFLARVLQTDLAEKSRDVFLQVSRLRTQMDKADPLVADPADPADQLRLLASLPGWELGPSPSQPSRDEDDSSANFPEYMPTPDLLDRDALSALPRVAVTASQIAHWKANPEPLLNGDVFLCPEGLDEEPEAFRVHTICHFRKGKETDRMFYVQSADQDEAFPYTSYFFFEMLERSERVIQA